jgi:hypothetical protein
MYAFYKPKLWKRLLGKLGFKKYQVNYYYGIDFGSDDMSVETSGHYDENGNLKITSFKVIKPKREVNYVN